MNNITKDEIIEKFRTAFITIKDTDCKKSHHGMVTTIHPDFGIKFFPTYHTAYDFYNSKGIFK